jgi:hypothetical protein
MSPPWYQQPFECQSNSPRSQELKGIHEPLSLLSSLPVIDLNAKSIRHGNFLQLRHEQLN